MADWDSDPDPKKMQLSLDEGRVSYFTNSSSSEMEFYYLYNKIKFSNFYFHFILLQFWQILQFNLGGQERKEFP